jgi:hypothetical protein
VETSLSDAHLSETAAGPDTCEVCCELYSHYIFVLPSLEARSILIEFSVQLHFSLKFIVTLRRLVDNADEKCFFEVGD